MATADAQIDLSWLIVVIFILLVIWITSNGNGIEQPRYATNIPRTDYYRRDTPFIYESAPGHYNRDTNFAQGYYPKFNQFGHKTNEINFFKEAFGIICGDMQRAFAKLLNEAETNGSEKFLIDWGRIPNFIYANNIKLGYIKAIDRVGQLLLDANASGRLNSMQIGTLVRQAAAVVLRRKRALDRRGPDADQEHMVALAHWTMLSETLQELQSQMNRRRSMW